MSLGGQVTRLQRAVVEQAPVAQGQLATFHPPGNTAPGQGLAVGHRRYGQTLLGAGIQHRLGQGVLAAPLQGAGQAMQLAGVANQRLAVDHPRAA
ncbi:hypothetical protein D3C79_610850 [compost metagenome]